MAVKVKHQFDEDDEPVSITVCRELATCGDGPCDNCFQFWSDDPRTTDELVHAMKFH